MSLLQMPPVQDPIVTFTDKNSMFDSEKKPNRSQALLSIMSLANYNTREMSAVGKGLTEKDHYDPY